MAYDFQVIDVCIWDYSFWEPAIAASGITCWVLTWSMACRTEYMHGIYYATSKGTVVHRMIRAKSTKVRRCLHRNSQISENSKFVLDQRNSYNATDGDNFLILFWHNWKNFHCREGTGTMAAIIHLEALEWLTGCVLDVNCCWVIPPSCH